MKNTELQKGKIPPQAIDLEEVVLGALLVDGNAMVEIDFLYSNMFYKEAHQIIFQAIYDVYLRGGMNVDLLTVSDKLKNDGNLEKVGGDYYLIGLTQKVSSSAHIEFHSRIIVQQYIKRELIKSSSRTIEMSYEDSSDVFDVLDTAYSELNEVAESSIKKQEVEFKDIVEGVVKRGEKIYRNEIKAGIPTPIRLMTEKMGGWRDTELIILAARPGMGKTSFAISKGLVAAKQGLPVAFFSLEMSKEQLTARILSMEYSIDNQKFNVHGLSPTDIETIRNGKKMLDGLPFYIDDSAGLTIEQFQIKAKRLKSKFGVKMIIVDYLQLMSGGNPKNREQEISKISRGLKLIAKELKIPVIALSQLSRTCESRSTVNKRPILSDLRESGAIEQDADVVVFIYRPEYYGITEWDDYDRKPTQGEAEYAVAKNRNGATTRDRMRFEGKYTLFSDLEEKFDANEFKPKKDDDMPF